jgi:hypothetical protein
LKIVNSKFPVLLTDAGVVIPEIFTVAAVPLPA